MRNKTLQSTVLVALAALGTPAAVAAAENTSFATSAALGVNTVPVELSLTAADDERWYWFTIRDNRSYCVEVLRGFYETDNLWDANLEVYQSDGTTLVGTNDDGFNDPSLGYGSRLCFISPTNGDYYARVMNLSTPSTTLDYRLRVVETTLFSPWYQVATGAGYDAAPQLRNTTNAAINVVFRARNAAGTVLPGCSLTPIIIPANGTTTFAISSQCATSSAFGGADIVHDGSPGGIVANITTFSAVSGLSFDAAFSPRQDFR